MCRPGGSQALPGDKSAGSGRGLKHSMLKSLKVLLQKPLVGGL